MRQPFTSHWEVAVEIINNYCNTGRFNENKVVPFGLQIKVSVSFIFFEKKKTLVEQLIILNEYPIINLWWSIFPSTFTCGNAAQIGEKFKTKINVWWIVRTHMMHVRGIAYRLTPT